MAKTPLRWFGGKGNLVSKLLPLVPRVGRPYCEPYAGGAALFWAREPAPVEVLNDIDVALMNFYQVLQNDELFLRLKHIVDYTLYARAEISRALSLLDSTDVVWRAWALLVLHRMGMGGKRAKSASNWGRAFTSTRGRAAIVSRWNGAQDDLPHFHKRIRRVVLHCMDGIECIKRYDNDEAVFYVDPPYHLDVRVTREYVNEPAHDYHEQLAETLLACKGAVTLSGYKHDVYQPLEDAGWQRIEFQTACHAAGRIRGSGLQGKGAAVAKVPRTECVWLNPKAQRLVAEQDVLWYNLDSGDAE